MTPFDWKVLRLRAGLTQHEAGQIIEAPSYEISRLETGRRTLTPEKLEHLRIELEKIASEAA